MNWVFIQYVGRSSFEYDAFSIFDSLYVSLGWLAVVYILYVPMVCSAEVSVLNFARLILIWTFLEMKPSLAISSSWEFSYLLVSLVWQLYRLFLEDRRRLALIAAFLVYSWLKFMSVFASIVGLRSYVTCLRLTFANYGYIYVYISF